MGPRPPGGALGAGTKHCHPVGEVSVLFSTRSCVLLERRRQGREAGGAERGRQTCPRPVPAPSPSPGLRGALSDTWRPHTPVQRASLGAHGSHPLVPRSDTSRQRQDTVTHEGPIMNVTFSNSAACFQKRPLSPKHRHQQICRSLTPSSQDLQRLVVTKHLHPHRRPQPSRHLSQRRGVRGALGTQETQAFLLLPAGAQTQWGRQAPAQAGGRLCRPLPRLPSSVHLAPRAPRG